MSYIERNGIKFQQQVHRNTVDAPDVRNLLYGIDQSTCTAFLSRDTACFELQYAVADMPSSYNAPSFLF